MAPAPLSYRFLPSPPSEPARAAEWGWGGSGAAAAAAGAKMSGSLARCVAPGNNALRSPAASEQHDDEGQAASLHHRPPC